MQRDRTEPSVPRLVASDGYEKVRLVGLPGGDVKLDVVTDEGRRLHDYMPADEARLRPTHALLLCEKLLALLGHDIPEMGALPRLLAALEQIASYERDDLLEAGEHQAAELVTLAREALGRDV